MVYIYQSIKLVKKLETDRVGPAVAQSPGHMGKPEKALNAGQIRIWPERKSLSIDRDELQGPEIHQIMIKRMLRIKPEEDFSPF